MQTLSASLTAALIDIDARVTPRILVDLYEFYASDYIPGAGGFDPDDAEERFAAEEITWNGNAYRREIQKGGGRGDIVRNMGEKTNSVTINFSNISRYLATWAQTEPIEGKFLVIRCVVPSVTDDSIVLFVGRCDKPGDIDKKSFSLSARQDFGNINQEIPPRLFTADDPEGRTPSDPLYEGIRITALSGTFSIPVTTASTSFFGRLLGKKKTVNETRQWSSLDATPYGSIIPMHFGRVQVELIPIMFSDIGYHLVGVWVVGEGRVESISNTTIRTDGLLKQTERQSMGDPGGTGTNNVSIETSDYPAGRLDHGYLSKTAYVVLSMYGSAGDVVDEAPPITSLVMGTRVPVPNSSGVFDSSAWSDNPVNIARFILTDPRLVGIDSGFMEDSVNWLTSLHCDEPLIDDSNGELVLLPSPDLAQGGVTIHRYHSTGLVNTRHFLYDNFGDTLFIPQLIEVDYIPFDVDDVPTTFAIQRVLRKRYTFNSPITEAVRAVDFLYKKAFPAAKLFLRVNKKGKYEIRSEVSADATMLRSATSVGATSIPILDVLPWKSGDLLTGRLLLGFGLTTSEVRNVSSALYSTSGNSVTLVAAVTGGVTATRSGATLSGGSTTVQASGTVTIGGTPAVGNTVAVTIDGIVVTYTLNADDTTGTVAAILAAYINAQPQLHRYISATWVVGSPTVVTIKCKHGALTLSSALLIAHTGPIADPTASPVLASSAGSLGAGTYKLAYADVNALGQTALSPTVSIVIVASKQIDVGAIALVGTSRNWYMSDAANSEHLKFVANTNGAAFSITALPDSTAAIPRGYNTTGEELIRVAMSFSTNSQDIFPAWRPLFRPLLGDIYLPTIANGHKYECTFEGTTNSTEPTWPTTAGATVMDDSVEWTEAGETYLGQSGLTRANIVKDTFKWPLGSRQSSVNQIKGNYRDATNDFALTPFKVNDPIRQAQVHKVYPQEMDLSAVDNFHQVSRLANWQLAKQCEGDWFVAFETGPQGMVLEEGDVNCVSDDSGGLVNVVTRIEELRIKPNHDVAIVQARKYSTLMFADEVGAATIPIPSTLHYTQTVDSISEFIDNFPIRDADALVSGFYISVSRDLADLGDWRGWALYADYGDGYVQIAEGDVPAIMGDATTTLGTPANSSLLDTVNSLTFTLKYGPPSPFPNPFVSVTDEELYANPRRNLFLVGDEYVRAATIVDNGNQSYTISRLLRACFGTVNHTTHGASERVVYLDGSEVLVPIDPVRLNTEYSYKVVTTNQDVSDATAVPFTWTGGTVKCLPPDALRQQDDSDTNSLFLWNPRSRTGAGMSPFSDVPLSEEREEYEFVSDDATPERRWRVITGMGLAALLKSTPLGSTGESFTDIDVNTLTILATGDTRAHSLQQITRTGNYIEATLIIESLGTCGVGLIATSGNWTGGADAKAQAAYYAELNYTGGVSYTLRFYVAGVQVYTEDASAYATDGVRIRLTLSGSEVRFTKSWIGSGTPAQYVSPVAPDFPLMVIAQAAVTGGGFVRVEKIVMTINPQPATIYTAAQKLGDGVGPGDTVKVAQVSAIVGPGEYTELVIT